MGPSMDVIGRYLTFDEPCDVSLHGTFLNGKSCFKLTWSNILIA